MVETKKEKFISKLSKNNQTNDSKLMQSIISVMQGVISQNVTQNAMHFVALSEVFVAKIREMYFSTYYLKLGY